jgi:signal transduction histidine kinase
MLKAPLSRIMAWLALMVAAVVLSFGLLFFHQILDPGALEATLVLCIGGTAFRSHRERLRQLVAFRDQLRSERFHTLLGKNTSYFAHNLKGLTELALGLSRQVESANANSRADLLRLQRDTLRLMLDQMKGAAGLPMGRAKTEGPANLRDLTLGLWNLYAMSRPQSNTWTIDVPDEALWSPISAREYIQMLDNLIKNALEASAPERAAMLQLRLTNEPDGAQVSLTDNGKGFPFHKACAHDCLDCPFTCWTDTTQPHGSGLGLSWVANTVRSWGGRIHVHPSVPFGTRLVVSAIPTLDHQR